MNKQRLRILAEIVEAVPQKQLDMWGWVYDDECGTVACAAGHACLSPRLRGLTLQKQYVHTRQPSYKNHRGWPALHMYFDLTPEEADYIFDPSAYLRKPRPKAVAERIRKLIGDA